MKTFAQEQGTTFYCTSFFRPFWILDVLLPDQVNASEWARSHKLREMRPVMKKLNKKNAIKVTTTQMLAEIRARRNNAEL